MELNAEGMPLEGIDRIRITLNPQMYGFIVKDFGATDNTNNITLVHSSKYNDWFFLNIQCQKINPFFDIKWSIAMAIYELIEKKFIIWPFTINTVFIYEFLSYFVYNISEIEFYFDFMVDDIKITDYANFNIEEFGVYSSDYRKYQNQNRPKRKSFAKIYFRDPKLYREKHIKHNTINNNEYKMRIEFTLTKQNTKLINIKDLSGTYSDVIKRYTEYLAIIFYNKLWNNVIIDVDDNHPNFMKILTKAAEGKKRYRGEELSKYTPPIFDKTQSEYFAEANATWFQQKEKIYADKK
jgi:hypothetical protein